MLSGKFIMNVVFILLLLLSLSLLVRGRRTYQNVPSVDFHDESNSPQNVRSSNDSSEDFDPLTNLGPPIRLPEGCLLMPDGSIRFPNATVLLTTYSSGAVPPLVKMPNGDITSLNGTRVSNSSLSKSIVPLNATENSAFPPLQLPKNTFIFTDGTVFIQRGSIIHTKFMNGFVPNCDGIKCHHLNAQD